MKWYVNCRDSLASNVIRRLSNRSTVTQHLTKVLLTRRRWDAYMTPLFLTALLIGFVRVCQTGQFRFAAAPGLVLPLWLMLRMTTPCGGMRVSTIRSTPGAVVMLRFAAATLFSMAIFFAIDTYVFGQPFNAPLEPYHIALFAPPFLVMFAGALWADRIAKSEKAKNPADDEEGSNA